jgi:hypothetical protein
MLAHAFNSPTKVTELGCTPSCCICQNSSIASCPLPHFTCPIPGWSKWQYLEMKFSWTLSKHSPCSHILHTCQWSFFPQRHQTHNQFEWAVYEQSRLWWWSSCYFCGLENLS